MTSGCRVSPGAASTLIDLILRQSVRERAPPALSRVKHPLGSSRQRQWGSSHPAKAQPGWRSGSAWQHELRPRLRRGYEGAVGRKPAQFGRGPEDSDLGPADYSSIGWAETPALASTPGLGWSPRVRRTVASRAATAPPATTAAIGIAVPSPPSAISGDTRMPPPNMQAPSTADAAPAAGARFTPSTVALAEIRPRLATTRNSGGSTASTLHPPATTTIRITAATVEDAKPRTSSRC